MKRILGLILSLVIGTALFVACGSPSTNRPTTNLSQTPTPTGVVVPGGASKKGNYNLEVSFKGFIDVTHSTITYGPNTAKVYLENKANTYEGKYEGVFDAKMTGKCEGFGTFPVSYDVTAAKEDEFGDLDFSVKESKDASAFVSCLGSSGSDTEPTKTKTYAFKLPAEDGASKTFTEWAITLTFTLKKQ
jgi:hypothetical protein